MAIPIATIELINLAIKGGVEFALFIKEIMRDMSEEEAKMWLEKEREEYRRKRPQFNPDTGKWE